MALILKLANPVRKSFFVLQWGVITACLMMLASCSEISSGSYWKDQHRQCVDQQQRLKKTSRAVEAYCMQWNSPLQRAHWLESNQGDPILIVENYLKHLQQFPESDEAKVMLAKARANFVDQFVKEMDRAIEQNRNEQIWKLAKDFQHIENLLTDYAPVPEMLSHYIRDTPEISRALQITENEINTDVEVFEKEEAASLSQEKGRFSKGFRAVLVVFCRNDLLVCEARYRSYQGFEE
ncbi:MAG: hypothetical protein HQM13_13415 [SAR324 cluster bacterium]|nr:hypothetical protein [SAR324 cluster bacterium]